MRFSVVMMLLELSKILCQNNINRMALTELKVFTSHLFVHG
jgi:hypothetical protein